MDCIEFIEDLPQLTLTFLHPILSSGVPAIVPFSD